MDQNMKRTPMEKKITSAIPGHNYIIDKYTVRDIPMLNIILPAQHIDNIPQILMFLYKSLHAVIVEQYLSELSLHEQCMSVSKNKEKSLLNTCTR